MPITDTIRRLLVGLALTPALALSQGRGGGRGQAPPPPLQFQLLGPSFGGRIASISGVAGDNRIWYLGAASGGVWKSTDDGNTFSPIFDKEDAQAIGALAVSQSDPNIVWAGTGEAWAIRDADVGGDGIYKSTDAGATWTNVGLPDVGRIGRILIHPTNPNIVYACTLGRATGPQQERGVYRTMDGGRTWQRVLFVDENTGCSGLTLDAHDSNTLFAGMWQVVMHTYAMYGGGPSSGLYVSHDAGTTWKHVTDAGLPKSPLGKIDVAVAPTDSKRVYALIQTADQGSVWRSDDGGVTWKAVNWMRQLIGRAGYYIKIMVGTGDANEVFIANSSFFRSTDGGTTFNNVPWGGDNHDIWVDPLNPDHMGTTDDAGAHLSTDHMRERLNVTLPIGQMYHVALDERMPYWVYTNRQDNGTMRGPSDIAEALPTTGGHAAPPPGGGRGGRGGRGAPAEAPPARDTSAAASGRGGRGGRGGAAALDTAGAINFGSGGFGGFGGRGGGSTWERGLGGCESGFTIPDYTDPNIIWASCYGNQVTRYDARTKLARSVSPWVHTLDSPPNEVKYRCHWTPPLAIDPFDHNTMYYGCQVIFKTSNKGQSWTVISPDLSTNDPSRIVSSGGIVADNLGQFYGEVVFAIAPSKIQKGLIWAGTNDGQLWYTKDGGGKWNNVTKNITGLPAWGTIRQIAPSQFDPGTAYVAVDFHIMDDRAPYLYKTADYGKTWTKISDGLPQKHPLAYVQSVAEDPNRKGMIFAGTGNAFYYSIDDGAHWTQFKDGLPAAPVTWIATDKPSHDVVVSTYGRGVYVMHDITTLEQKDKVVADAAVYLYEPNTGVRQARAGHIDLFYDLKAAPKPKDSVTVEIMDAKGAVVRTMREAGRVGRNLAVWDLRGNPPLRVDLRTTPPDDPHIWEEPRFKGKTVRPITHWGIENPIARGPLVLDGKYSARVTAAGTSSTQPFTILRDPEVATSEADIAWSTQAQTKVRDDMDSAAVIINSIEKMRRQIEDRTRGDTARAELRSALKEVDTKLLNIELVLLSKSDFFSDDKYYVEPFHVYLNLIWLSGEIGTGAGDVAGGAEFRPTDASLQVLAGIETDLNKARTQFKAFNESDLAKLNQLLATKSAVVP
ncbi:MAG: VPS10 domain-containing protein [Gemmatimonadaceae bacterium]